MVGRPGVANNARRCRIYAVTVVACVGTLFLFRHAIAATAQPVRVSHVPRQLMSVAGVPPVSSPPPPPTPAPQVGSSVQVIVATPSEDETARAEDLQCSIYSGPMRWRWNPGGRGAKVQRLGALPLAARARS